VLENDLADRLVVLAQERHHVFGIGRFRKSGEATQITEQGRDFAAMPLELLLAAG